MKVTSRTCGLAAVSLAALGLAAATAGFAADGAKTYIVQMKSDPLAKYDGDVQGLAATKPRPGSKLDRNSAAYQRYASHLRAQHDEALTSVGGGRKIYSYEVVFNGFAAELSSAQVEALRARSDVLNVWEDELMKPQTQSTPFFLNLANSGDPWAKGYVGENIIIGIIDTGIQPDHPSLADVPTRKKGNTGPNIPFGPAPAGWTGTGCEFGNTAFNPNDAAFTCNNKLLKAEAYPDAFMASGTAFAAGEFLSARDSDGHGTHTATTAGGNSEVHAEIDGDPVGEVFGMAPRARIAVYKVCWDAPDPNDSGCFSSDSMAAIDQAVEDGVDVINFSIGGPSTSFLGVDDIAFLFAADAGVWVSVSAGNTGPGAGTIGTPSGVPWVTSVGALEDDENFGTGLRVNAPASVANTYEAIEGAGPVQLEDTGTITEDVVSAVPLNGCTPLTNGAAITGNIALVIRGVCNFDVKYNNAAAAGARAIVVYNDGATPDRFDPFTMAAPATTIPGVMIGFTDGALLNATAGVNGTLSPDISVERIDRITGFSSRGPNGGAPDIIKPDIAAPGVNIIAGETLFPNAVAGGGQFWQFLSGTSMASPHVAGIYAVLKQAHPEWSAAIARSAIMTTARTNLLKTFGPAAADPFDVGAGLVRPREALDPGLAYDVGFFDYLAFLCGAENQAGVDAVGAEECAELEAAGFSLDSSDLNLPSIGIADLVGSQTVTRTVTNVGKSNRRYKLDIHAPRGVDVQVSPQSIQLAPGESATYTVTFTVKDDAVFNQWTFGDIQWFSDNICVTSRIAVRPIRLVAPTELRAEGSPGNLSFDVQFGYTGDYNVAVNGLVAGARRAATSPQVGAQVQLPSYTVPAGTTLARFAMYDADNGNGANDFDLFIFGPNGMGGFVQVASSGGPTSEEEVNLVNPAAGTYIAIVVDFASLPGPTPFSVFNFNLNGSNAGNTTVATPPAVSGTTGEVDVSWTALGAGTRHLGILNHREGTTTLRQTELLINTQ